jgi:hypothetical protein
VLVKVDIFGIIEEWSGYMQNVIQIVFFEGIVPGAGFGVIWNGDKGYFAFPFRMYG